jgi:hypothetical protein
MRKWWGALGIPVALLATLFGYAASPDYRAILLWWMMLALAAIIIFVTAAIQNRGRVRWVYAALLAVTCFASIEPAERISRLLFS